MSQLNLIDTLIVFAYLAAMVLLGLYAMKKRRNVDDYYVGGRKSGPYVLACLWMSSWIGGATVIGSVDKAYSSGLTAIWYCGSMALGCVIFALTSTRLIQRVGERFQCLTYPELIECRYGPSARLIATITTFLAYVAYTAGQFLAMAKILSGFLGWDLNASIWVAGASMVIYTALGGFIAVTLTGVPQALAITVSLALVMAPILYFQIGGLGEVASQLPAGFLDVGAWGWGTVLGLMVTIILTFYTSMDSYTRCFAARDGQAARRGTFLAAGLVAIVAISTTFIGLAAKVQIAELPEGATAMSAMVALMPTGIRGLILVGLLAAIMSTGSVCILVASANISQDIYKRFINPRATSARLVVLGSLSGVVVGVLSVYLAIARQDVIGVLYIAFTVNSAGLFIPTLGAFIWNKGGGLAAALSMGLSLAVVVFWYVGQSLWPSSGLFTLDPVWPGLLVSALVFITLGFKIPLNTQERLKLADFCA